MKYDDKGASFEVGKDTAQVDLWYPRQNPIQHVRVGLIDVRAADDIRIHYDFHRDGWSVMQASVSSWEWGDKECDEGWKEAAFIPAWQFNPEEE